MRFATTRDPLLVGQSEPDVPPRVGGGYLWSPKRNANGARNPCYEFMREVSPGDVIFSFVDSRIAAVGIAQSFCWESPKPKAFGTTGEYWENTASLQLMSIGRMVESRRRCV